MSNKKYHKFIAIFLIVLFLFSTLSCNTESSHSNNSGYHKYQLVLRGDAFIDRVIYNEDTIIKSPFIIQKTFSLPFKTRMNEIVKIKILTSDDECYRFEIISNTIEITGDNDIERCGDSQIIMNL